MKYEIGKRIKFFREKLGLSQKEVADRLNISNAKLSNWEKGTNRPPADFIANICTVLDVTADELLGLNSKGNQPKYNLSFQEKEHLNNYRRLNDERKKRIDKIINMELEEQDEMDFINSSRTFSGSTS